MARGWNRDARVRLCQLLVRQTRAFVPEQNRDFASPRLLDEHPRRRPRRDQRDVSPRPRRRGHDERAVRQGVDVRVVPGRVRQEPVRRARKAVRLRAERRRRYRRRIARVLRDSRFAAFAAFVLRQRRPEGERDVVSEPESVRAQRRARVHAAARVRAVWRGRAGNAVRRARRRLRVARALEHKRPGIDQPQVVHPEVLHDPRHRAAVLGALRGAEHETHVAERRVRVQNLLLPRRRDQAGRRRGRLGGGASRTARPTMPSRTAAAARKRRGTRGDTARSRRRERARRAAPRRRALAQARARQPKRHVASPGADTKCRRDR